MNTATESSFVIAAAIHQIATENFGLDQSTKQQFKASIAPIISNSIYQREKELLEQERVRTLLALARTLDDAAALKLIKELGYTINVKDKE